jgi:steroid delta-isomerase-like uncharacterized protein
MSRTPYRWLVLPLACAVIVLVSAGCASNAPAPGGNTAEEQQNVEVVRQFVEEVLNKGNLAFIDEHVAPEFVDHNPVPGQPPGVAGLKQFVQEWRASFPDLNMKIDDVIAKGDLVVLRSTTTGTHQGTFMGMAPTQKPFSMEGIDMVRFKDGKVSEHWGQSDMMGMMTQLGMIPAPDSMQATAH